MCGLIAEMLVPKNMSSSTRMFLLLGVSNLKESGKRSHMCAPSSLVCINPALPSSAPLLHYTTFQSPKLPKLQMKTRMTALLALSFPKATTKPFMCGLAAGVSVPKSANKAIDVSAGQSQRSKRIGKNLDDCALSLLKYVKPSNSSSPPLHHTTLVLQLSKSLVDALMVFPPLLFPKCYLKFSMS
jgi:hypothetical protein